MSRKDLMSFALVGILFFYMFAGLISILPEVDAAQPAFTSWSMDPVQPTFDKPFNISVEFDVTDEAINQVQIQMCHGVFCEAPEPMTDEGDGESFFYLFPAGGFGEQGNNVSCYFHLFVSYGSGPTQFTYPDITSHELSFNIIRVATEIEVTANPDSTTVFPNETVTVSGTVTDDLGANVSSADVNLSIVGEDLFETTTTDEFGDFSTSIVMPEDGDFELNLTISKDGMMAYDQWDITVNSWPLPALTITGEISYDDADLIPGETGLSFYVGTELELIYQVSNTGSGTAFNITSTINQTGWEDIQEDIGNLTPSPTQRYEGTIQLNTTTTGLNIVSVNINWDQEAPEYLRPLVDDLVLNYTINEIPTWEDHTVLIEMFTQTTCVPCVDVEEALEWLDQETDLDFNLLMYVYEDQASELKANELGVTSTPDVFIDHTYKRISGGGEVESLKEQFRSEIENASKRDTPPLSIDFEEVDGEMSVSLMLGDIYTEEIEGIFQVYSVEKHSNIRNHQGIPISHRYHGVVSGMSVDNMGPGSTKNLTVPMPDLGMGYIATIFSPDGKVLQSASYFMDDEPDIFIEEGSEITRITSPGTGTFNVTLEVFRFEEGDFGALTYELNAMGLSQNVTLEVDGTLITSDPRGMNLNYNDVEMEIKDSGRVRYYQTLSFIIDAPEGASGTLPIVVNINSSGFEYTYTALTIITPDDGIVVIEDPEITDVYLEGVGGILNIWVEANDVPVDALIKVRILPCNYGENALCGVPKEFTLAPESEGKYRTSISGVDLETFTHLTFNAWIESGGVKLDETEEKNEEISDHIDVGEVTEDPDPDDPTLTIMLIVGAILVLFIILIVIFVFIKKGNAASEDSEQQDSSDTEQIIEETEQLETENLEEIDGEEEPVSGEVEEPVQEEIPIEEPPAEEEVPVEEPSVEEKVSAEEPPVEEVPMEELVTEVPE